jgi:predicted esterase
VADPAVVEREAASAPERLLVLLPGSGDEPASLEAHLEHLDPGRRWHAAVVRPPVDTADGPVWFTVGDDGPDPEQVAAAVDTVTAAVDALRARVAVDDRALAVAGYSQGGAVALATLLDPRAPARPATACLAGYLLHREAHLDLARAAGRAVLIAHGADDEVVDVVQGRGAARTLERAGASVTWVEATGGHRLGTPLLDPLRSWLDDLADGAGRPPG